MADTVGTLIDKLFTTDTKMWNGQEELYKIRRMTFEQYKEEYFKDDEAAVKLWECLKKACDLNVQRNQLINEIDQKIIEIVQEALKGKDLDNGSFVQRSHKTY